MSLEILSGGKGPGAEEPTEPPEDAKLCPFLSTMSTVGVRPKQGGLAAPGGAVQGEPITIGSFGACAKESCKAYYQGQCTVIEAAKALIDLAPALKKLGGLS